MGKLAKRKYFCPWCEHSIETYTNHTGEIYPGCKNCGSSVLYHQNPQHPETKEATFHAYYLNIGNPAENEQYEQIIEFCTMEGYKLWETQSGFQTPTRRQNWIKALKSRIMDEGLEVTLFNPGAV